MGGSVGGLGWRGQIRSRVSSYNRLQLLHTAGFSVAPCFSVNGFYSMNKLLFRSRAQILWKDRRKPERAWPALPDYFRFQHQPADMKGKLRLQAESNKNLL